MYKVSDFVPPSNKQVFIAISDWSQTSELFYLIFRNRVASWITYAIFKAFLCWAFQVKVGYDVFELLSIQMFSIMSIVRKHSHKIEHCWTQYLDQKKFWFFLCKKIQFRGSYTLSYQFSYKNATSASDKLQYNDMAGVERWTWTQV